MVSIKNIDGKLHINRGIMIDGDIYLPKFDTNAIKAGENILKISDLKMVYTDSINDDDFRINSLNGDKLIDNSISSNKISENINLINASISNLSFNSEKLVFIFINTNQTQLSSNNYILNSEVIEECYLQDDNVTGGVINIYNNTSKNILISSIYPMYNILLLPSSGDLNISIPPYTLFKFIYFLEKWYINF